MPLAGKRHQFPSLGDVEAITRNQPVTEATGDHGNDGPQYPWNRIVQSISGD